jgi:hypothetical protein
LRDGAATDLQAIFLEGHIAYPARFILNGLMPSHQFQKALRRGALGRQTGDAIDHFHPFFTGALDLGIDGAYVPSRPKQARGGRPGQVGYRARRPRWRHGLCSAHEVSFLSLVKSSFQMTFPCIVI